MLGVLLKTVPVDMRKNAGTYLLMCLLVAVSMYVASAFSAITYSYTVGSEQNYLASNYQDGQFQTTTPLTAAEEEAIKGHGYNLERAFYFDVDEEDGSTLRIMRVRKAIDLPILDDGSLPVTDDEAMLEKCYAYMHELTAGDTMEIGARPMTISGVGSVTDYNMPSRGMMDYSSDSEAFGLAFVTDDAYASMLEQLGDDTRENYIYSYKLAEGSSDEDLRMLLAGNPQMLEKVTAFTPRDNNNRMCSAQNDNAPYAAAGLIVGIGLLVLIAMVFFLKSRMSLERDSAAIGALIATGVSRRDVMLMVLAPSAIVALVGGAIGYLLSLAFPLEEVAASEGFYSIPYIPIISHPAILAYCLLTPVLVCSIINALQIRKQLGKTVLSLLRGEPDSSVRRGDILAQRLGGDNSHAVHILSHLFREKGIVVAMLVGTVLAAIIFMLGRGVGAYCGSIEQRLPEEVRYQYVYELPEEQSVPPAQGSIALKHAFAVEDHGFVRDIDFIGIEQDNPYFDVDTDALDGGIAMSTATASRFGLSEGDEFTVYNGVTGEEHTFLVKQMTDYSVALSVFMDIDDMRALLGENDASYNTVFSDEALDYPKSKLKNALRKIDYISPLEKLGPVVASSRDTFYLLAILLYVVTMLYLMRFAVTRGIREIGVLCALGFHAGEICAIFTMGMVVLSVLVAAVGLWIAYGISQLLMPYLVASTPIGLMIDYPLSEFLVNMLFACCVIALSFALAAWSVRKFDLVQFLRSRE